MIVVIGDIIIDEYVYGTSTRLSPEAPVPVVKHVKTERKLGGAGNVYKVMIVLFVILAQELHIHLNIGQN